MRSEKHKLSQPPRLKSIPKFLLSGEQPHSEPSDRGAVDECDPIFLNKNKSAFDEASFRSKYERALELISKNKESESRNALTILEFLCGEIPKLPVTRELSYELLENVVINCWRLKNSFKDIEVRRQEPLAFIRAYVGFFAETYRREQVHKNGLHMLYLIQANEQFDEKLFADALRSCELSIKHCGSVKNQPHLLKVEYLKCNIHSALGNNREEAEAIKRCLFYINTLMASAAEENLRDYVNQLKKNLLSREAFLKDNPNHQKSLDIKKTSFSLFRKRSLSHKRQGSQKELASAAEQKKELQSSLKNSKRPMVKSIHTRSANISKYNPSSKEEKATFLPVDLTKFNKPEQKLKKKPLRITERNRANDFQEGRANVMDEIEEMTPVSFNYESLMVRRPNEQRKHSLKKSTKAGEAEEVAGEELLMQEALAKKESNRSQQQEKIEPVTHYISKSMHTNDEVVEQEQEELVRECVRLSEEALLKTFLRKLTQEEENQFVEKPTLSASNHPSRLDSSRSSDYSSSNDYKPAEDPPEVSLNRSETNHFEYFEPQFEGESNFSLSEGLELVTYAGILSRFKFSIKIQKKEQLDETEQFYKQLHISFCAVMNRTHYLHASLAFRYYNPFEKNLEIILDEICKNELEQPVLGESIKQKLVSLVANRLLVVRKPNGLALVQKEKDLVKENSLDSSYTEYLRDRFIIYEENQLTSQLRRKPSEQWERAEEDYVSKRSKQNPFGVQAEEHWKQKKDQLSSFNEILNYYLPKLIRRMTDDLKEEKSSLSSLKRMKTERFYKDTILSFKSLIKSMNESDLNARMMFEDQKSLSLVMPSDFNSKISNFFEHEEGAQDTSIYEFYYCMKFILIQPSKSELPPSPPSPSLAHASPSKHKRRITIDKIIKESEKEWEFVKPKYLQDTLGNFYDMVQVEHLFRLRGEHAHIKMTCYKVKEVFKKTEEYFYKFEMQFKDERIQMMKFIATSYDIYLLVSRRGYQLKSSRKKEKAPREDYEIPAFNRFSLLTLLKEISQRIFVKKDYIYSIVGLQAASSHFNYINKFRLEGKTVQNKQFMIPHLKCIRVLLQRSIRIACDHFRQYAVLTVRQIDRSSEFHLIFYLPAQQRTYSIGLTRSIVRYLLPDHRAALFADSQPRADEEVVRGLFGEGEGRAAQRALWSNFSKLFRFEVHYYEDRMHMLLRIGSFVAFLKDCCFSEFFELRDKIFHLEMSLARKSQPSSEFELRRPRHAHPKRKSASSKELIKRNFQLGKDMKSSGRAVKPSIARQCPQEELFRKGELFDRLSKIYERETSKYILYVSLGKIYEIEEEEGGEAREPRRVTFSFYLSDLLSLLKESKKELATREEKLYNEFNEEVFSFAILLRAMTVIKYRLVNELKRFKQLDLIFEGADTVSIQKQFKNNLVRAFCSQNENLYSLNSSKRLYRLENNIFLINKSLMGGRRSAIVSIFYDQKGKRIKFYLANVSELANKQKLYSINEMKFPWIEFYRKDHLFKLSARIYTYYKNILLFT